MTSRKSSSPREILSRFDEAVRRKREKGRSSAEDFSIFDVLETKEKHDAQAPGAMAARQVPDRAEPEQPTADMEEPWRGEKAWWQPSWELAEAAQGKQLESDTTMKASPGQSTREQTGKKTENRRLSGTAKTSIRTTRQKAMMMLLVVLSVVFFFGIKNFIAPRVAAGGNLTVKGILHDQNKPSAIVNKQIVHEGDKISGATIIKINRDNVEFEVIEGWLGKGEHRRIRKKVSR